MRKFNYRSSNKNKKSLKYGGYASITTIILVTALVLVNVLFNLLGWKVDLTVQKLYTPGDITTEIIESLDEETLFTIQKFFENSLNVSETSRKLFVHRNTLVYRLEKIKKITGLDLREFDNAIVLKVALMVKKYLKSRENYI